MKVTVTTLTDEIFNLDVSEDLEVDNFKAFCAVESGIPTSDIHLVFDGRPLTGLSSLKSCGVKDGDVIVLQKAPNTQSSDLLSNLQLPGAPAGLPSLDFSSIPLPSRGGGRATSGRSRATRREDNPAFIREMFLANPDQMALLKQNNPRLADALLSGNDQVFVEVLSEQQEARAERERLRSAMLTADPFDVEAQRLIADEILRNNVEANMEAAIEYHPESFGSVVMLYIDCKVNGYPVKAFIDSGAQATIMSANCAERCNIKRLIDARWSGIAKGVGTQRIIGRIHTVQLQIQDTFLPTSFSVLEEQPMDMLLGLDMLKRHQCLIDLRRNVLLIGTTNTETPFLAEADLPECARLCVRMDDDSEDHQLAKAIDVSQKHMETAAAGTSSSTASTSGMEILPSDKFTEADVNNMVSMGFSRVQVLEELRRFNGDITQATASLFAKSIQF